jgi:hypothetical protein
MSATDEQTVAVAEPRWVWVLVWLAFPGIGAGAGWGLYRMSGWLASLPWAPKQRLFQLLARTDDGPTVMVAMGVGAGAGLLLAAIAQSERLTVLVAPDQVTLIRAGRPEQRIGRQLVGSVFAEGKHVVLLTPDGGHLAREPNGLEVTALKGAFERYGYPWRDGDPDESRFRLWVPGLPGLPAAADALLSARQRALAGSRKAEVAELRDELGRVGIVVRERGGRQYVRSVRDASGG